MVFKRQSGNSSYPTLIKQRKYDVELKGGIKGKHFPHVSCNKCTGLSVARAQTLPRELSSASQTSASGCRARAWDLLVALVKVANWLPPAAEAAP